jgi:succinate dehydrogenase cytochrome b subunit
MEDPALSQRSPNRLAAFYRSTVGKKAAMAVSGIVLFVFLFGHLAGNLQIFLGAEKLNDYAALLKRMPESLWLARIVWPS